MDFKRQGLELRTKLFNLIRERSFKTGRVVHRWRRSGKPLSHLKHLASIFPNLDHAGLIYYGLTPSYEAGSVLFGS